MTMLSGGSRCERVPLRHVAAAPQWARLREPLGRDELALEGIDTQAAARLLGALIDAPTGAPACSAAELSATDRDALLAALHRALWGDRIVSSLPCAACGAMYDFSLELSAVQRQLAAEQEPFTIVAPRCLQTHDGQQWHLPSAAQEQQAAEQGVQAGGDVLCALVRGGQDGQDEQGGGIERAAAAARLESLAPILDLDLQAQCPECSHQQLAHFNLQAFVLQRLLDERDGVISEVHALASSYGWGLNEILSLPRSLRRALVQRMTQPSREWM